MMTTSISVIVPAYQPNEKYLNAALSSIARQTRPPDEVILILDGGTISTSSQLCIPKTVRTIKTEHCGAAAARNKGIAAARASWIAFLDADDEWPPSTLESLLSAACASQATQAVYGLIQVYFDGQAFMQPYFGPNLGAGLFRRDLFSLVGHLDETMAFGEDIDFYTRLLDHGCQLHIDLRTALHYRLHKENSVCDRQRAQLGLLRALAKSLKRRNYQPRAVGE